MVVLQTATRQRRRDSEFQKNVEHSITEYGMIDVLYLRDAHDRQLGKSRDSLSPRVWNPLIPFKPISRSTHGLNSQFVHDSYETLTIATAYHHFHHLETSNLSRYPLLNRDRIRIHFPQATPVMDRPLDDVISDRQVSHMAAFGTIHFMYAHGMIQGRRPRGGRPRRQDRWMRDDSRKV